MVAPTVAFADAIGTWKIYPCYNNVSKIVPAGDDIFVLASGNLYSYNTVDNSLTEYTKNTCLSSSEITDIAWVQQAKQLVIIYSDYTIDLLPLNQDVTTIADLANKQMTGDKTINDIYVNGKNAYLSTGFGIIKLNVSDAYIVDTYNLEYKVDYCYIDGGYIYAESSEKGKIRASLTANLLDKNNWKWVGNYSAKSTETYVKDTHNNCYWAADSDSKLTKYEKQSDGKYIAISTGVKPNGPTYQEHNYISYDNGRILSLRGRYEYGSDTSTPGFVQEYDIASDTWKCYDNSYATAKDKRCITHTQLDVDPRDKNHIMVASKSGLYSYKDGKLVAYYDMNTDDPIKSVINNVNYSIVTGVKYDASGNLWIFNLGNTNLVCLTASGEWKTFPQSILSTDDTHRMKSCFIDSRGLLWFVNDHWVNSMCGFYDIQNDKMHVLTEFVNEDGTKMSVSDMFTVAEDQNNNIWIGSLNGCFYLKPADITAMKQTDGVSNVTVTQHKVPRNDGTSYADYLLDGVSIYDIKIDGANRKWFATDNGVYLISSDGNTQISHFTTDNSPLPTNFVKRIALDGNTGEVYFGTTNGLCSYKSDVQNNEYGTLSKENVYAYPNPVTPDYSGMITIVGLTSNAQIKILTSSGQLVNEGTCNGGSYQWNGCDLSGNKVASGVYMVCIATEEGSKGVVTKIGVVR